MKKKVLITVLTLSLSLAVFPAVLHAQDENAVKVNGEQISINSVMENDRLLVPMNGVFEKLGAEIKWDKEKSEVYIEDKYTMVELFIGKNTALVHKKYDFSGIPMKAEIDVTPRVIDNTVYIPLRFVAENMNASVEWDSDTNEAQINSKKVNDSLSYEVVSQSEIEQSPVLAKWYEDNKSQKGFSLITEKDNTYVLISGGMMKTGGYSIKINGVVHNSPEELNIYASIETPSKDSFVTQVITYPSIVIKINKTGIKYVNGSIY